jgi:hypothetical protein
MMVLVRQLDLAEPVELRGYLQSGTDVLTETWSNLVPRHSFGESTAEP